MTLKIQKFQTSYFELCHKCLFVFSLDLYYPMEYLSYTLVGFFGFIRKRWLLLILDMFCSRLPAIMCKLESFFCIATFQGWIWGLLGVAAINFFDSHFKHLLTDQLWCENDCECCFSATHKFFDLSKKLPIKNYKENSNLIINYRTKTSPGHLNFKIHRNSLYYKNTDTNELDWGKFQLTQTIHG